MTLTQEQQDKIIEAAEWYITDAMRGLGISFDTALGLFEDILERYCNSEYFDLSEVETCRMKREFARERRSG